MKKYLIRLDDASPYMDLYKWDRMECLLDHYKVKPMVGIIPDCQDKRIMLSKPNLEFWGKAIRWQNKGWALALHGYDHIYISKQSGINPIWNRSEFAGVPLEMQKKKIKKGYDILRSKGVKPCYFFAPSHTFDNNTLEALRQETDIRIISDTIGRYPYKYNDFYIIPQFGGHCIKMLINGIYTFCFHPNSMDDVDFDKLDSFLNLYHNHFISFDDIELNDYDEKRAFDRLLSWLYFTYRRLRGVK